MWLMIKRVILIVLLLGFAGACSYLYFYGFKPEMEFGNPLKELPEQTLALIHIDKPGALLDALDNQPNVRDLLGNDPVLLQWMAALREAPQDDHPNAWIRNLDVLIAVVPKPNLPEPALIWGIGLPTGLSDRQAIDQFEQLFLQRAEKTALSGATAFSFQTDPPCVGIIRNDAMFLSTSEEVLSYMNNKQGKLIDQSGFTNAWESCGNADANLVIDMNSFPLELFAPQITPAKELAQWTVMDVNLLNQGIEVNGVFFCQNDHRMYGSNSADIPQALMNYIPDACDQVVYRAWENPIEFAHAFMMWNHTPMKRESLAQTNWFNQCLAWCDNGIGQFTLEGEPYVILGMADTLAFYNHVNSLPGRTIHRGNIPSFSWQQDSLWQKTLPFPYNIDAKAGCIIDDWLVLSESEKAIKQYLLYTHRRKPNPKSLAEIAIGTPQVYAYSELEYFGNQLKGAWSTYWNAHQNTWLELTEGVHFTAYTNKNHSYFRVRLQKDSLQQGPVIEWEHALSTAAEQAVWVKDHRSGEYYALAIGGTSIFALDARGTLRWSLDLRSPIASLPQPIDLYKNGKIQVIFNTENAIHCLDVKGREVEGFPIELANKASSELTVFDYDNNRDYRFLIATTDGQILNFQQEGVATKGWKYKPTASPVKMLKHVKAGARDYIFALHADGQIELLKRNGEVRFKTDLKIKGSPENIQFQMGNDIASSRVLFVDENGQIFDQTFGNGDQGKLAGIAQGRFIIVEDIDNDRIKDLVVVDDSHLVVYNATGREILETTEIVAPSFPPAIFQFNGGKYIGLVNTQTAMLGLVDHKGSLLRGFPIEGKSTPSIRNADSDGKLELLTVSLTGKVLCYELE